MAFEITSAELTKVIAGIHFANDGDSHERKYWALLKERFPNCEQFWRLFVVPTTRRIECAMDDARRFERRRVAADVWAISYLHYSLSLHLGYSSDHLRLPLPSSFGDFYSHLGSACDLAEDFLLKVYLLVTVCRGGTSRILQALTKNEWLEIAADWYDQRYPGVYDHYLSKGKGLPIKLPTRASVVGEYLSGQPCWSEYQRFAQRLREYRNVIVHDVSIGEVVVTGGVRLVPKKEKIQSYRTLDQVFAAAGDPCRLKTDFVVIQEQMLTDFADLQNHLNSIWEQPLSDFRKLFLEDANPQLLGKYDIALIRR